MRTNRAGALARLRSYRCVHHTKENRPGRGPEPVFVAVASLNRALAPVAAAEAEAAEPGRCPSPGLPIRPGTSASPEVAAEAAAAAAEAEAEAEAPRRSSTAGSAKGCASAGDREGRNQESPRGSRGC